MTDHPHPLTETAREVLAIQDRHRALNARTGLDLPIDINDMSTLATAAPDLARAAIAVSELADRLDNEADHEAAQGDAWDAQCIRAEARRIRDALDGDA